MQSLIGDLRYGLRHSRRTPFATLTMIVVLALGIGFNTALFVFIYSLVNGPLPGVEVDASLVRIRGVDRSRPGAAIGREFSYTEYQQYASERRLFSAVAAWTSSDVVLDVGRNAESLHSGAATYVTDNYFPLLGVQPSIGTGLPTNVSLVAVISDVVWDRFYGRSRDVVGTTLKVNDVPVTIVGVAPPRFNGARTGGSLVRVWLPLSGRAVLQRATAPDEGAFGIVARLQPGVDVGQALPAVQTIAARFAGPEPRGPAGHARTTDVVPLLADNYFPPSGEAPGIAGRVTTLMIPVVILLITCTNVSALLAGVAVARRREIAVRLALGASRRRVVRQLVTESVVLALAGGTLALAVIWALLKVFESRMPDLTLILEWRAILFTFGCAILTGIVFGISPALHATRLALSDVLKNTAGAIVSTRSRLQAGLVVAQIAFTQPALLAMGALILEVTADLREVPSPVFAERIVDVRFNTNPRYGPLDENREHSLRRLQTRFAGLQGVEMVVPQENSDDSFRAEVHPMDRMRDAELGPELEVRAHAAPAGYFPLMEIPFVRGRDFAPGDADSGGVVLGADLARRLWGSVDPIGKRLTAVGPNRQRARLFTVVGVVDETRAGVSGGRDGAQRIFVPGVRLTGHLLIRTDGPAQPVIPLIRSVANTEAPELPLVSAATLETLQATERRTIVQVISAVGGGGLVALFLSAIGLYAVVAFAVGQRSREIGIRTALGAGRRQVVGMFVVRGLRLGLIGLSAGLTLSVAVVRLMALATGAEPQDGVIGLAALVASIVIGVALLAAWIPARRAAHIDPLEALRVE